MGAESVWLVLIETAGNQRYIFASNKLRENVGASELTRRAGMDWLADAVKDAGGPDLRGAGATGPITPAALSSALLDENRNAPLEDARYAAEVVVATSGKALVLARCERDARAIVRGVTARALRDAPGLDVKGVATELQWTRDALHDVVPRIHELLQDWRGKRPSPNMRHARLPWVAECATSGLPAARYDFKGPEAERGPRSAVALAKRGEAADRGFRRLRMLLAGHEDGALRYDLPRNIDQLQEWFEEAHWLGVVHADGNGLGHVFRHFGEHADASTAERNRRYVTSLRSFSVHLEQATEKAFEKALGTLPRKRHKGRLRLSLVPLVLGGDDLTVLCDGQSALGFANAFLLEFEDRTRKDEILAGIAQRAHGVPCFTGCAGVAIVKPHFPFHAAYGLAEALVHSAKDVKRRLVRDGREWLGASALDFHVLYDASGGDLDAIRSRLRGRNRELLYDRPYVVSTRDLAGVGGADWAEAHLWARFVARVNALLERDEDGKRRLPASQAHWLREGLFLGADEAEARLGLIRARYPDQLLSDLTDQGKLFRADGTKRVTAFMDAMEAAEFVERRPA